MRILVANEPRSYREVIAAALHALRPGIEVITVDPDMLDPEIQRLMPQLVLCSRLTLAVQSYPLSWIMLYPGGTGTATFSINGQLRPMADVELGDILALVDETERLDQGQNQGPE